jgi:hypothetical protein
MIPIAVRKRIFNAIGFDDPLPLSSTDAGPAGGSGFRVQGLGFDFFGQGFRI